MKILEDLLNGLSIKKLYGPTNILIEKLCFDSRQAIVSSCFIAIKGTQVDGHDYIPAALAAGSIAIVCEVLPSHLQPAVTYVLVGSTAKALGIIAANLYDNPSKKLKVIAVTGTNGKTTIVHLLYNMVKKMGHRAGMLSTVCNKVLDETYPVTHTTPDALSLQKFIHLMVEKGCAYCFMEASSHALVQERLSGLHITGAIFTNITHEHLDYHNNFYHYIQSKKRLFDTLSAADFALVNKEDKHSVIMLQNCKAKKFTYSVKGEANFKAKVITHTIEGLELEIDNYSIWFPLIGVFNASNLVAAYATAQLLCLESQESLVALSSIPPVRGRMERITIGKVPQFIIDFAHTPDALTKVIDTLHKLIAPGGRLVTIMGCGGNRDTQKRAIIGKILADYSDISIFTSDNPREEDPQEIILAMQQGVAVEARSKILHIVDRAMAIKTAYTLAKPNDVILVAGKGHQNYEEIKGVKHYFCEKEIIEDCLNSPSS